VLFYRRDGLRREVMTVMACSALSLVGTAFLFYSALDWGRWIHIQAICLMLMVLLVDRRAEPSVPVLRSRWLRYAGSVALVIYATTWTLPSIGRNDARQGYLDVIHMLRSYRNFK
jgi:peptidoglycan/LPS O-acetylase OafA/YrhL